ncbi:DUF7123 family protein [Methanogenium cariaci]|jgi:hypothetical protein|uniref:DUF7123 family protein n=1 Tax=Methanogenium cariaci TaxID=2197 RepID=UPI0007836002|nr:hypothetical protein [Methanogenium cariaci]
MNRKHRISDRYSATQDRILSYLVLGLETGKHYFKSKYIAKDLGLSSKEVGTNLAILSEICDELDISRWSYSNSTTWHVLPRSA